MTRATNQATAYQLDYCAWLNQTIDQLKQGQFDRLDRANLIEELEGLTRSEKNALKSNLTGLLMHLLKCRYESNKMTRSWRVTIDEHRERIEDALAASPSLKRFFTEVLDKSYQRARKRASLETGLPQSTFPEQNPFSVDKILNEDFFG